MTLSDVVLPITYEWGKDHALVFSRALASRLAELHAIHGDRRCVPMPRELTDGRMLLWADILTEVMPGGMLHAMWAAADKEVLGREVAVLPWDEAVALLPPDPVE